jgi:hypothetical protein
MSLVDKAIRAGFEPFVGHVAYEKPCFAGTGAAQNRRGLSQEQSYRRRAEFFALPNSSKTIFETSVLFLGFVV